MLGVVLICALLTLDCFLHNHFSSIIGKIMQTLVLKYVVHQCESKWPDWGGVYSTLSRGSEARYFQSRNNGQYAMFLKFAKKNVFTFSSELVAPFFNSDPAMALPGGVKKVYVVRCTDNAI